MSFLVVLFLSKKSKSLVIFPVTKHPVTVQCTDNKGKCVLCAKATVQSTHLTTKTPPAKLATTQLTMLFLLFRAVRQQNMHPFFLPDKHREQ